MIWCWQSETRMFY